MVNITLSFSDDSIALEIRSLAASERTGEAFRVQVEAIAKEPVDRGAMLGQGCVVVFAGPWGERRIAGVVREVSSLATTPCATTTKRSRP